MLAEVLPSFNSIDSIFASIQDHFQDTVLELDRARASFCRERSVALGGQELVQSYICNEFTPHAASMTKKDIFRDTDDDEPVTVDDDKEPEDEAMQPPPPPVVPVEGDWANVVCSYRNDCYVCKSGHEMPAPVQCQMNLPGCVNSVHHSCQNAYPAFMECEDDFPPGSKVCRNCVDVAIASTQGSQ
eukprot:3059211-Rhodomonas_salina.1